MPIKPGVLSSSGVRQQVQQRIPTKSAHGQGPQEAQQGPQEACSQEPQQEQGQGSREAEQQDRQGTVNQGGQKVPRGRWARGLDADTTVDLIKQGRAQQSKLMRGQRSSGAQAKIDKQLGAVQTLGSLSWGGHTWGHR